MSKHPPESALHQILDRRSIRYSFQSMQVTVDLPDQLAQRLKSEPGDLAELIESGLRLRDWVGESELASEIIRFLASGPQAREIISFRPSEAGADRARELLRRNRDGSLTPAEKAEMDEMALLDHFMTLIKARAWEQSKAA